MKPDRAADSRARMANGTPANPWNSTAMPGRLATTPPLPPLPGESSALIRARELIRRGPASAAQPAAKPGQSAPTPPELVLNTRPTSVPTQPVTPPAALPPTARTQHKPPTKQAKTYMRPDGTVVPDRRTPRRTRVEVPAEPPPSPPAVPLRNSAPAEIVLELPGAYATTHPPLAIPIRAQQRPGGPPTTAVAAEPEALEPVGGESCPICHDAGFLRLDVQVGHPAFGKAVPCVCRERELTRRRRDELWKLSRLEAFAEMTFETFNATWPGTREAFEATRKFAAEQDPPWLVLSGPCGSGKTHLAAAIANVRFAQGEVVLFTVVPQLLDHLRATFGPESETTYDTLFEKVREAGLLVLDDLGAEHTTPWAQEKLFQIINHRYIHSLPTVITTNQSLHVLDDRVRSRVSDIRLVRHLTIQAEDYRPRNAPPRRRGWDEPLW